MKDTNELIAEFMGMQDTDLGWYDSEEAMSEYACQIVGGGNTFEVLQYDRSWDWLMPVVEEIDHLQFEDVVEIETGLKMRSLSATYNAVVEFIKQQNKNKKA
jgi:hypothetical protein